jgi:hypothetical protein
MKSPIGKQQASFYVMVMVRTKDQPEVRRAKARLYVSRCNKAVHEASWAKGDVSASGGVFIALELAEQAYLAHALPYEPGLSKMILYDPRRFTWIYDHAGEAIDCVKVRDNKTGCIVVWPHF